MADAVLDASAVLAIFHGEAGADVALRLAERSIMSAVNYAETIGRLIDEGAMAHEIEDRLARLGLEIVAADQSVARTAALMVEKTRGTGTSLADRFFLALAKNSGLPAVTTDRRLGALDLGVEVRLIR